MVRPIEITDVLSKVQVTERIQQNLKASPEAAQQFQKELSDRIADEQVKTPQPPQPEDQIILREEGGKNRHQQSGKQSGAPEEPPENEEPPGPDEDAPAGHIDIRV